MFRIKTHKHTHTQKNYKRKECVELVRAIFTYSHALTDNIL